VQSVASQRAAVTFTCGRGFPTKTFLCMVPYFSNCCHGEASAPYRLAYASHSAELSLLSSRILLLCRSLGLRSAAHSHWSARKSANQSAVSIRAQARKKQQRNTVTIETRNVQRTIPFSACAPQYTPLLLPGKFISGCFLQPFAAHFLFTTSTCVVSALFPHVTPVWRGLFSNLFLCTTTI